jgi:hypothetical protein
MKEILMLTISVLLIILMIFLQLRRLKINHPDAELLVGLLNRLCSNSDPLGSEKTGKNKKKERTLHHGKQKARSVHMRP